MRRLSRGAAAALALVLAAVVAGVAVVGLLGLLAGLVLTEPMSQGRTVAAALAITGGGLLLVVYAVDPYALRRAVARSQCVIAQLIATVTAAGRR